MRAVIIALACLLIGAAPAQVPVGKFQNWVASEKVPLTFTSGGVTVHVAALLCPSQRANDSCRFDGYNNQAAVTVTVPGARPVTVETDDQASYIRVAVVRFEKRDLRPGVIVENQYGGSGGKLSVQLLVPSGNGYRIAPIGRRDGVDLEGKLQDSPRDLSGDGSIDLKFEDGAFDSAFGCNACSPRPPILFAVKNGKLVDESRDPGLRGVFAADMARLAPRCLSKARDRNGACAAYVANAARAGRFDAAWAAMLKHYEHDGRTPNFPESLRAFLARTGYAGSVS